MPKERRLLERLGVRDGHSILEVGCGPGFVTERLLADLPRSQVTTFDRAAGPLHLTGGRLLDRAAGRLHLCQATAEATGFADDSFDVAIARFVFQHLSDPVAVAVELRRVLRPGGLLVVIDVDDDLFGVTDPDLPEVRLVLDRFGRVQARQGGDRRIGRKLRPTLAAAGFEQIELDAIAFDGLGSDAEIVRPQLDPAPLAWLADRGSLSDGAARCLAAARDRFFSGANPYVLRLIFLIGGRKPTA